MNNDQKEIKEQTLPEKVISSAKDIFEQIDTDALVATLESRITGAWAYEFPMDGKPVRGLSAAGVDETALFIAQQSGGQMVIRTIGIEKVEEEPDCFKAAVKAGCYVLGFYEGKASEFLLSTSVGYAKQPKVGVRKDGSTWDIIHAEVMSVRKAERNAKSHLIPDKVKAKIMEKALEKGKISSEDPDSQQKTSPGSSQNGDKGASPKQIELIEKFMKNKNVTIQMKKDFEKDREGLTIPQASKWIQYLQKVVEGKGEKEQGNMPL